MGAFDAFVEKYIRLSDDLHDITAFLNDIRLCLVALTASCYVGILFYAVLLCVRRSKDDQSGPRTGTRRKRLSEPNVTRDAEAGVDEADEWDDMMPPPPDSGAVRTLDGYRYKSPAGARKNRYQNEIRLQITDHDDDDPAGRRRTLPGGKPRYSTDRGFRDGFVEKSPSVA